MPKVHTESVASRYQWCCKCLLVSASLHVGLVPSQIFLFCCLMKQCLFSFRNQMDCLTATNPSLYPYKMHWPFRKTHIFQGNVLRSELLCSHYLWSDIKKREHRCCVLGFCFLITDGQGQRKKMFFPCSAKFHLEHVCSACWSVHLRISLASFFQPQFSVVCSHQIFFFFFLVSSCIEIVDEQYFCVACKSHGAPCLEGLYLHKAGPLTVWHSWVYLSLHSAVWVKVIPLTIF